MTAIVAAGVFVVLGTLPLWVITLPMGAFIGLVLLAAREQANANKDNNT
jgi:hypothetical protein